MSDRIRTRRQRLLHRTRASQRLQDHETVVDPPGQLTPQPNSRVVSISSGTIRQHEAASSRHDDHRYRRTRTSPAAPSLAGRLGCVPHLPLRSHDQRPETLDIRSIEMHFIDDLLEHGQDLGRDSDVRFDEHLAEHLQRDTLLVRVEEVTDETTSHCRQLVSEGDQETSDPAADVLLGRVRCPRATVSGLRTRSARWTLWPPRQARENAAGCHCHQWSRRRSLNSTFGVVWISRSPCWQSVSNRTARDDDPRDA
jgi:hypothetical protein